MGFFDEDLVKPKHDELMIWLDSNIESIVNEIFNKPFDDSSLSNIKASFNKQIGKVIDLFSKRISDYQDIISGKIEKSYGANLIELQKTIGDYSSKIEYLNKLNLFAEIPIKPRITSIQKVWELPVMSQTSHMSNKYTVGFIDFAATFDIPRISLTGIKYKTIGYHNEQFLDDIEDVLDFVFHPMTKSIYVEVKTEIKSIGELIRQINHYRTYLRGDYYVLCPDNSSKNILEEQNIGFINYK
jgi:hypothetical protein